MALERAEAAWSEALLDNHDDKPPPGTHDDNGGAADDGRPSNN
jgi:hypothetical protein